MAKRNKQVVFKDVEQGEISNSPNESHTSRSNLLKNKTDKKKKPNHHHDEDSENIKYNYVEKAKEALKIFKVHEDEHFEREQIRSMFDTLRSMPEPMCERRKFKQDLFRAKDRSSGVKMSDVHKYKMRQKLKVISTMVLSKFEIWSNPLKAIEGRYGTGVVSYFVFLRWLLFMNVFMFIAQFAFIVLPSVLSVHSPLHDEDLIALDNSTFVVLSDNFSGNKFVNFTALLSQGLPKRYRRNSPNSLSIQTKSSITDNEIEDLSSLLTTYGGSGFIDSSLRFNKWNYTMEQYKLRSQICHYRYIQFLRNTTVNDIWAYVQDFFQGTGWMANTVMFLGYYEPYKPGFGIPDFYNVGFASLMVLFFSFGISIMLMLFIATKGIEESMLGHNLQETYCYLIMCGWDFSVSDKEAATHKHNFIYNELASSLNEGRKITERKMWSTLFRFKIFVIRCLVHLFSVLCLIGSYYALFYVSKLQRWYEAHDIGVLNFFMDFLPSLTVTAFNMLIPIILNVLVKFECYRMRNEINILLVRIILLREASMVILLSSFYEQINCHPKDVCLEGLERCQSPLCWETYVGQQLYRLVLLNIIVNLGVVFLWETPKRLFVTSVEKKYLKPQFKISNEVLGLIYSQTLCWLGLFFCPLLPAVSVINLIILFYAKKYTLFNNCGTQHGTFRASRSNAIFAFVLMLTFLVSLVVVGYSITELSPSPSCSPYRIYKTKIQSISLALQRVSPQLAEGVAIILSPLCYIPTIMFLCLLIYYYLTKAAAHDKMVELLKIQLVLEGRDKQYLLNHVAKMKPQAEKKTE